MELKITKIRRVWKVKLFLSWHSILNIWWDTKATSPILQFSSCCVHRRTPEKQHSEMQETFSVWTLLNIDCQVRWKRTLHRDRMPWKLIRIWCLRGWKSPWGIRNGLALTVQHDENSGNLHLSKCQKIRWNVKGEITAFFILPIYYSTSILICQQEAFEQP